MKNGQQKGNENQEAFSKWIQERNTTDDWPNYIYRGKVNRREIAKECKFAESVTRQNPRVRYLIEELEIDLEKRGILIPDDRPADIRAAEKREQLDSQFDKRKLMKLEEQNAQLLAENVCLKEKLKDYNLFDEHLMETGRLVTL